MTVTLDKVDAELARLGAECDRMAGRLVELDGHSGVVLLDTHALSTSSRARWDAVKATLGGLWAAFEAYRTALDSARSLRGSRPRPGVEELAARVYGPAVELPVEAAGLTGPAVQRVSFDELARRMDADYRAVHALVDSAARSWSRLAVALEPISERFAAARATAETLGLPADPELHAVGAELDALRAADPLTATASADRHSHVTPGHPTVQERLEGLGARLQAVAERLEAARRLHDSYDARRAALVGRLDELRRAGQEAAALHATVATRISPAPAAPDADRDERRLRVDVEELDTLHAGRDWARLAARYREVDEAATGALSAAGAARDGLQQLLDRRSELRGRLEAYRAKAGTLGYGEDATLLGLHRGAHELLWSAPCDLPAATRAVAAYQQAVLAVLAATDTTARRGGGAP